MTVGKSAKVETLEPQNSATFDLLAPILVSFDSARQELQNELSHGPDTAAQGHLPFYVTHVTHGCHVFTLYSIGLPSGFAARRRPWSSRISAKVETLEPQNSATFDLLAPILASFDSARQELQNELSHGPDTAAQGHL
ncbi:hypothetical protein DdX_13067 [Ditylenchus destructor]|uniref:Uncharacterized protein n=1 Tax=Ditylenchus destructor TaxID=166010 RepID=A0AAD4R363_9BILA|nr:hypothetical protein DdX_13067 [Ditylenchus destructor]